MESPGEGEAPFDAPASACGLACLLLLLEGAASPKELFGFGKFGSIFAVRTIGVRLPHEQSHMQLYVRDRHIFGKEACMFL